LQTVEKFFFNSKLQLRGYEGLRLSLRFAFLVPFVYGLHFFLCVHARHLELSFPDDHLVQLGKTLLAFVPLELGPELEVFIQNGKCLLVVLGQLYLLPELLWQVGSLDRLHVEVTVAFVLQDGGIACVCERTRVARAQAREVVLVATKCLRHCSLDSKENCLLVRDLAPTYFCLNEQ